MRLSEELRRHVDRLSQDPLPPSWAAESALAEVASFGELIGRLRQLDARCDELLRALARLAEAGEPEACLVVTAALLPLLIARCDRDPSVVGEAINELAARVTEPAHEAPTPGVANRLLCRVVRRVRHEHGAREWQVAVPDPAVAAQGVGSFEAEVVDRLALEEFRRRLLAQPKGAEAWAMLVNSAAQAGLSSTQRTRLGAHRRRVRPLATASLVA